MFILRDVYIREMSVLEEMFILERCLYLREMSLLERDVFIRKRCLY